MSKLQFARPPIARGGWRADLDKIFEIGKGFVGLLETDLRNCSPTKCFKRGARQMPAVDSAFEWISRNSVVFAVFKNCQKLSASFLLETRSGIYHAHIQ